MNRVYLHGVAHVKKQGDTLYIASEGEGVVDEKSVVATGSDTPRTLADRFGDIVNVRDFGAVGDGVTDDTEAIQKAFKSIQTTGGTVLFPADCTYCISDEVKIGWNVTVLARGAKFKAIGSADKSFGLFSNWLGCDENPPSGFAGNGNIFWFGGDIDCGGASVNANTYRWAMMFAHGDNIHVWFVNFRDARRVHTCEFSACRNSGFHYCNFYGQFPPVVDNYYPEVIQIDANTTSSSDRNPDNTICEGITFEYCLFTNRENSREITESSPWAGVGAHGTLSSQVIKNVSVTNCTFKGVRGAGVQGTSSNFNNFRIENNTFISCGTYIVNIQPTAEAPFEEIGNIFVRNNYCVNGGPHAIRIIGNANNPFVNIVVEWNTSESAACFSNIQRASRVREVGNRHSLTGAQTTSDNSACYFYDVHNLVVDDFTFLVNSFSTNITRAITVSTGSTNYQIGRVSSDLSGLIVTAVDTTQDGINGAFEGPKILTGFLGKVSDEQAINSIPALTLRTPNVYYSPSIGFLNSEGFRISSYKQNEDGSSVLDERVILISTGENGANFGPGDDNERSCGFSSNRWSQIFAATAAINTSDSRCKSSVTLTSDALLDAWGSVPFHTFQFTDAVEKKGEDSARLHVGVIAQEVESAFETKGLDAERYGLFCHDEWQDEYETVEVVDQEEVIDDEGNVVTPRVTHTEQKLITAAGDRYGIRYEEALCLEAAYQRRRAQRLEEAVSSLETRLTSVEALMTSSASKYL